MTLHPLLVSEAGTDRVEVPQDVVDGEGLAGGGHEILLGDGHDAGVYDRTEGENVLPTSMNFQAT